MGDCLMAVFVCSPDRCNIMSGFFVSVRSDGVTVRIVHVGVAVRLDGDFRTAVAEVPGFFAVSSSEGTHLKSDFVAGLDMASGIENRMDRRR